MFVWVAMTVVMVGWDYQRETEPPAVIAISLRGLSSIKHPQESLVTSGADHLPSDNQKRFERVQDSSMRCGGIRGHPAIKNDSSAICVRDGGGTIWIADAHRDDGKRFVVRAGEKLTAFLKLESAIRVSDRNECRSLVLDS